MKVNHAVGVAAISTALAFTAACSSSGTLPSTLPAGTTASGASGTSATGTAPGAPATTTTSDAPTTTAPTSAAAAGPLTADQLTAALLSESDVPGAKIDPNGESTDPMTDEVKVLKGGAACQKFIDATGGLVKTYGTVAEADRSFVKDASHAIDTSLMSFPSADKAKSQITDVKLALAGCKSLTIGDSSSQVAMGVAAIATADLGGPTAAYSVQINAGGKAQLWIAAQTQIGSATASARVIGDATTDKTRIQAMVSALDQVMAKEVAKLKAAEQG